MILQGDALTMLRTLPSASVHMAITSPLYWNLRDYRVAGQLGLERSYDEYISKLCSVFDEVQRVLRPDGTCWVNVADSYSGSSVGHPSKRQKKVQRFGCITPGTPRSDIPRKSLCLVPSRFAIEMVRRVWLLRNTIIWHKPNVISESVSSTASPLILSTCSCLPDRRATISSNNVNAPRNERSGVVGQRRETNAASGRY